MNALIKSAIIVDEFSSFHNEQKDVLIENGVITKIANRISNPGKIREIKRSNLHLSCGWFDCSVSFGEPGFEERETIENGLKTAAKSGFTAVALNSNTQPLIDSKASVEYAKKSSENSVVTLYPIASLSKNSKGEELAELYDMSNSGAIAFGDYQKPVNNANLMKIALLYAKNFDGLVLSFPENEAIANNGIANEGIQSVALGLKGNPGLAEELQIARDLFLLEYTQGRLHVPTISTAKSLALIKAAKKKGLDVSCSVSAHHLTLNDAKLATFNSNFKLAPPLRTEADVKALLKGVQDKTIDMITSDHNPINIEAKELEFENATAGTVGLETLFGALNKVLALDDTIRCISTNPRKRFGLAPLSIQKGQKANLTLFNPDVPHTFTEDQVVSTSKNSAFIGEQLNGKVYGVIAQNKVLLNEN